MSTTLYHLPNSRSQRIIWLFEELNIPYDLKVLQQDQLTPKAHVDKCPTIHLSDENLWLRESSAIAEYFCQQQQKLTITTHEQNYWDFCYFKNFADASFMPNLALKQVFAQIAQQTPWLFRVVSLLFKKAFNHAYLNPEIKQQLDTIEQHLADHTWLASDVFSYADILMWFPLQACQHAYPHFAKYTAIQAYLARIHTRPAFQVALEKGQWSSKNFQHYWQITQ